MLPAGYNNAYRILQTPDHVVIYHEMIHDARIIPLSDRPFVGDRIRQWMGDARAHWEGEVLVVETKNFHDRGWVASSGAGRRLKGIRVSEAHHVVERFERVSETTVLWDVTITDPKRVHVPLANLDAVDGRTHLRDVRVRVPRGKLRRAERAQRGPLSREAYGVDPGRQAARAGRKLGMRAGGST